MASKITARLRKPGGPDRSQQPAIHAIDQLVLPEPELVRLDNGLEMNVLHFPGQQILKVEAVYFAGRPFESKRIASRATARLQREGTLTRTGAQVAEHFDFYGASLTSPGSLDTSSFALFSLHKHAAELLPVMAEVLHEPAFPQHELEVFQQTNVQELQVELDKVEVLTYRKITELIFGENHPYGYNSTPDDYKALTTSDLQAHFERLHTPSNARWFVSGCVDDTVRDLLNRYFGQAPLPAAPVASTNWSAQGGLYSGTPFKIKHKGALQASIKLGRVLFTRKHPDFNGLAVLNTILGGYFGSRLMSNIREKKGYTYNIYSTIDAMLFDGYWYIGTEVSPGKVNPTLKAIYAEMKKLREEPVPESELNMVKNYLLGLMLTSLDGPINTADVVRSVIVDDVGNAGFEQQVAAIRSITAEELLRLAQVYLKEEDFLVVVAG